MDVEAVERVEAELDAFINKRSRSSRKRDERQDSIEAEWALSDNRQRIARRRQLREEWAQFHLTMHRLHQSLADEHASKRSRLLLEGSASGEVPG
jgi:hypothetical protein